MCEMMRRLGFVSMKDQAAMLKYGAIINCPVTPADVYRAQRIYGTDIATLKRKTEASPSRIIKIEPVPCLMQSTLTLFVDIIFVEGDSYLLSVSKPLGLTMANHLGVSAVSDPC